MSERFSKPVSPVLARQPRPVFGLDFVAQPSNTVIFLVNHRKPRELDVASANHHS
jgi:hypothetical protein